MSISACLSERKSDNFFIYFQKRNGCGTRNGDERSDQLVWCIKVEEKMSEQNLLFVNEVRKVVNESGWIGYRPNVAKDFVKET